MIVQNTYSELTIDLDIIYSNYKFLKKNIHNSQCAAVLKADAYGLGLNNIAPTLYQAGCRHFFVAYVNEAIALKKILLNHINYKIYVLNGPYLPNWQQYFFEHDIIPVLNTFLEIEQWQSYGQENNLKVPAILHVNTGMHRLGLPWNDYCNYLEKKFYAIEWQFIMSHLSSADEVNHAANLKQLRLVRQMHQNHPHIPLSLSNSSGVFLGAAYHFDMVRTGISLYGINSINKKIDGLESCLKLKSRILQIQQVDAGQYIGYGETFKALKPMRLATLAIGYADGIPWALSNKDAYVKVNGDKAEIVGRISMDLITVDITDIKGNICIGDWATILDQDMTIEWWSEKTETIPYEILLKLGQRLQKVYCKSTQTELQLISK